MQTEKKRGQSRSPRASIYISLETAKEYEQNESATQREDQNDVSERPLINMNWDSGQDHLY